jgi:hypothetical protein
LDVRRRIARERVPTVGDAGAHAINSKLHPKSAHFSCAFGLFQLGNVRHLQENRSTPTASVLTCDVTIICGSVF